MNRSLARRHASLVALFSGALMPLAFAPFGWWPVGALAMGALFWLWGRDTPGRAAWHGFLFALAMYGWGISWLYVSMHRFGNMSPPLAVLAVVLVASAFGALAAAAGWSQARLGARPAARLIFVMPAAWVASEWSREWVLGGFPWLTLGYSYLDTPLSGLAPWSGVYGVSLVAAGTIGLGVHLLCRRRPRWIVAALGVGVVGGLAWLAGQVQWVQADGGLRRVSLVQGNVPLEQKWIPARRGEIIETYLTLTEAQRDSDLVVWPEAAVPGFIDQLPSAFWQRLRRYSRQTGAQVLVGVLEREAADPRIYYNTIVAIQGETRPYRKRHLVPFGEYLLLRPVFGWLLDRLEIPMSDFTAWTGPQPRVQADGIELGLSICYEDSFPGELAERVPGAGVLVNVSEDSWFGESIGPRQRVQMARMRALELGRPMLRAATSGVSGVFDHRGRVVAVTEQFVTTVLTTQFQPMTGLTPFGRWGSAPVLALLVLLAVGARLASGRRSK